MCERMIVAKRLLGRGESEKRPRAIEVGIGGREKICSNEGIQSGRRETRDERRIERGKPFFWFTWISRTYGRVR